MKELVSPRAGVIAWRDDAERPLAAHEVRLALENVGQRVLAGAEDILQVVEAVGSPRCRVDCDLAAPCARSCRGDATRRGAVR
jgi:hypothetical protein